MLSPKVKMWLGLAIEILFNCLIITGIAWTTWSYLSSDTFDQDMIRWAEQPYTRTQRFNAFILTLTFGGLLFQLKYFAQFYYGLIETAFAITACLISIDAIHSAYAMSGTSQGVWFGFASSLYLLVRGLSNMIDGWKKDDTTLKKIITGRLG